MYSSFFVLERVKTLSSKISGEFLDDDDDDDTFIKVSKL